MKNFITIILICFSTVLFGQQKRYLVNQGGWGAFYDGTSYTYNPGDTLVFKNSNAVVTMALANFHGTIDDTVYVMNESGEVSNLPPFLLRSCSYIKVTGTNNNPNGETYGLVSDMGFGYASSSIDIDGRSEHIVVEKVKFMNNWYSIRAKQDGSCDTMLNYPNWRMKNILIQDTWSINVSADCMYLGNTAPVEGRAVGCPPPQNTIYPIPMRLANFICRRNIIEHVGRTAIQLSGADSGYNEISDNIIIGTGYENSQSQGSGIIIGGMSQNVHVLRNSTRNSFQFGVYAIGYKQNYLEENNIDSSGMFQMNERDKATIVNTDTGYIASRCYFSNMGEGGLNVTTVKLTVDKITGTTNGYAYIVGKAFDNATGWPMNTENTFPSTGMVTISDTFNFANVASQSHVFTVNAVTQFFKVVIKQSGTQENRYKAFEFNNWYPYSIGAGTRTTGPIQDSSAIVIQNNICSNEDSLRGGTSIGISDGEWFHVNGQNVYNYSNVLCNNRKQNGSPALLGVGSSFEYVTKCEDRIIQEAYKGFQINFRNIKF